jgi:hypothetical protein
MESNAVLTPCTARLPASTNSMLDPMLSRRSTTTWCAPRPSDTMVITAAMPMDTAEHGERGAQPVSPERPPRRGEDEGGAAERGHRGALPSFTGGARRASTPTPDRNSIRIV